MYKKGFSIFSIVIGVCLILSSAALAGPASVTPAAWLPGDGLVSPAYNTQIGPAIALGSGSMLLAWTDGRAISSGGTEGDTARDIYGMRLDLAGNILDPVPFVIAASPASQVNPKVSWNGANWLVVYESNSPGGTGYYEYSLAAVRVSPSGQVLDQKPIQLYGQKPSGGPYWSLASDGSNWVVVNQATSSSADIVAQRISPTGVVLDPPVRAIVQSTYYMRSNIKLAYSGGVFLMTFDDVYLNGTNDTKGIRFDANLNLLDPAPFQLLTSPASSLVGAASGFYLAWDQQQPDFSHAVYGSRLNTAGQKLDGTGDNLSGNFFNISFGTIAAAWDGLNWKVSWLQNGSLRIARVNTAGSVLDPGGAAVAGPQADGMVGTGSGGLQTVWSPYLNGDQGIMTANISASNAAGPNRDVSLSAPMQTGVDMAASGSGYMLVYRSSTSSSQRVLAQPLDASGNPLTAEPVQLDTGDVLNGPGGASVAWNGSLYLAAWANSSGIVGQRLQPNGAKIDPAPFLIMAAGFGGTDVEAIGDTFLVVGRHYGYTPQIIYVVAGRVRGADGAVLDASPFTFGGYASSARVVALGGRWLVAFQNNWSHDNSGADTVGAFISDTGVAGGSFALHSSYSTAGGNGLFSLGLASTGNLALLVQSQELTSGVETDLLAKLINPDGSTQPTINLTPWRGNQYNPRVAWDGQNFVIVYQEQRNRLADLDMLDSTSDLFGMRITAGGAIVDPQGFVFSNSQYAETLPNISSLPGATLIAGSLIRPAPFASYRIGYQQVGLNGNQWPVVGIAANPSGGDIPLVVNFSSAGTSDPDGSIVSYAWDFGDGSTAAQVNPSHTYTTAGPFIAQLTATDNAGAKTTQAILVQAVAPNQPPVADAVAVPASGPAPLNVVFSADGSYDPDGQLGNIKWTFHDGSEYWGSTAYYTYSAPGTYQATLTVYDSRSAADTDTVTVTVGAANQPPVAKAAASPTNGVAPLMVSFSSAGSSDPDGTISSYSWTFGDGGASTQANPAYTYQTAGSYTAVLTVTDNAGATASSSVLITVNPNGCSANCLRSTAINLSTRGRVSVTTTGQVTVKNEKGQSVSGATVYITWTRPDTSQVSQNAKTNTSGVAQFSTTGAKGVYTILVTNILKTGLTFDPPNSILTKSITAK